MVEILGDAGKAAIDRHEQQGDEVELAVGHALKGGEVRLGLFVKLLAGESGLFEGLGIVGEPPGDGVAVNFRVVLDAVRPQTEAPGLDVAVGTAGEVHGIGREFGHGVPVPVKLLGMPRHAGVKGIDLSGLGEPDRVPAEPDATLDRADRAAERPGEQLTAEADAEDGQAAFVGLTEEMELIVEPPGFLVERGAAGGHDAVDVVEIRRQRVAPVEFDDVESVPVVA